MRDVAVGRAVERAVHLGRAWSQGPLGPLDAWAAAYTQNRTYSRLADRRGLDHPYTWPALQGVRLAKVLGYRRVSLLEFGVAGGRGLLTLETLAGRLEAIYDVAIEVYGFDTGAGLSKPLDHRDMPNLWSEGFFAMDVPALRARLRRAELVLGPVSDTVPEFVRRDVAPVAFASFDVDLYSSTRDALRLLDADPTRLLPRVHCYFDDILGYTFGDHVGERLAVAEFNEDHADRKISQIHGLRHYVPGRFARHPAWDKQFMAHLFDHDRYNDYDGSTDPDDCGLPAGRSLRAAVRSLRR